MARNRIEQLLVDLEFRGGEELKKISSGFRELAKAANLADGDIEDSQRRVKEYAATLGNTAQATKGTIEALKTLQGVAQRGGDVWSSLSRDILAFEDASRKTDQEIRILREQIVSVATGANQSQQSIQGYITSLKRLRTEAVIGGEAFDQLGQDIEQLNGKLRASEAQASRTGNALTGVLGQAPAQSEAGVRRQLAALDEQIAAQREIINSIDVLNAKTRQQAANVEARAQAEEKLNRALAQQRQLQFGERVRAGRQAVRTGAAAFNDPTFTEGFFDIDRISDRFGKLPNTTAALNQELSELSERLINTTRGTGTYLDVALRMAAVQREAATATRGLGQALFRALDTGVITRNQKNLQEVIGVLRAEMAGLNPALNADAQAYRRMALQVAALEREMQELINTQRQLGSAVSGGFGAFSRDVRERFEEADPAIAKSIRRNTEKVENETARLRAAAQEAADLFNARTPLMLPAAGQTSAPGTGLQISGGARVGRATGRIQTVLTPGTFPGERQQGPAISPEQADEARRTYLSTAEAARVKAEAERLAAESAMQLRAEVDKAAQANNGSINSIQRYRDSLVTLRNTIPSTEGEFKRLTAQVQQLDAQLERAQRRRHRMGAMQATQAAGAVISGGIFGGPEGAIGGAIGTAVGGVPGAFAGAAIGAQVGMIRQSLGQTAAFTAEIDKQRIALRNVVGSQAEYQSSLQFIDATSRRLAIPQDQLNKQFTQLSASVIGAGGNVDAAKIAFEGIAAGIRGTGGNLNDMEAALRATAQVFSKGKVSAEELRQQIGERLPGAFTIFAESMGKTPQELDKALERGEVSLNDFMKFAQALSQRYGASANEIAASSQAAGDRIQVTFARLREAIGRELQPVGAQFQEIVSNILVENEQNIINFATSIAAIAKTIADNSGLIVEGLKALLGAGAIVAAIPIAINVAAAFAKVTAAIAAMGGIAGVAQLAIQGLNAALLAVPGFGWAAAGVVALGLLGKAVYDNNELFRNWVDNIANVVAADFERSMDAIAQDAESATARVNKAFEGLGNSLSPIKSFIQELFDDLFGSTSASGQSSAADIDNAFANAFDSIESNASAAFSGLTTLISNWWQNLPAPIRNILGGNTAAILVGATQYAGDASARAAAGGNVGTFAETGGFGRYGAPSTQVPIRTTSSRFPFDLARGDGDGRGAKGGKGSKGPESRAAELRIELALLDQLLEGESLISQAKLEGNRQDTARLQTLVAQTRLAAEAAKVELDKIPAQDKALRLKILEKQSIQESAKLSFELAELEKKAGEELKKSMEQASKQMNEFKDRAAFEREYGELIREGTLPATARQYLETKKVVEETIRAAEAALAKAEADGASADEIERQRKELERIKGEGKAEQDRIAGGDAPSKVITDAITRIQGELNELLNIGNQVVGAATAIGDAFSNSFKGLITGATSAKEALASFFSSVADYFADMAAKMIAEWIKLAILNTIVRIFNPTAGAGLSDLSAPATINNPLGVLNANGNAFAQNGIVPYAKGGIVNKPTMFKFARGGTMQTGVMGEAGPEAIMPLKRGADGKLGVAATGSGVTVNVSVDAKGTSVQGDPGQGQQLGRAVAAAVQQELIKQQRPGGLLAGDR